MKAKVIAIESGSGYADGERRVEIKFEDAEILYTRIRVKESVLPQGMLLLDEELLVTIQPAKTIPIDAPLAQAIRHDAQLEREAHEELGGEA